MRVLNSGHITLSQPQQDRWRTTAFRVCLGSLRQKTAPKKIHAPPRPRSGHNLAGQVKTLVSESRGFTIKATSIVLSLSIGHSYVSIMTKKTVTFAEALCGHYETGGSVYIAAEPA